MSCPDCGSDRLFVRGQAEFERVPYAALDIDLEQGQVMTYDEEVYCTECTWKALLWDVLEEDL